MNEEVPTDQDPVSRKYLTVVYRELTKTAIDKITSHPSAVILSWSNAVHDRDLARKQLAQAAAKEVRDEQQVDQ